MFFNAILNGAAIRKVQKNDLVIILSYTWIAREENEKHKPLIMIAEE
jgi:aspartate 1-decarboxylase